MHHTYSLPLPVPTDHMLVSTGCHFLSYMLSPTPHQICPIHLTSGTTHTENINITLGQTREISDIILLLEQN